MGCDGVDSAVRAHLGLPRARSCGATMWRSSAIVPPDSKAAFLLEKGIVPMGLCVHGPCTFAAFNFHSTTPSTMAWSVSTKQTDIAQGTQPWTIMKQHVNDEQDSELIQELFSLSHPDDLLHVLDLRTIDPTTSGGGTTTAQQQQQQETTTTTEFSTPEGWGGTAALQSWVTLRTRCDRRRDWAVPWPLKTASCCVANSPQLRVVVVLVVLVQQHPCGRMILLSRIQ